MLNKKYIQCDVCVIGGGMAGIAATIAVKNGLTPHDVYLTKCDELQTLLLNEDCFLPHKIRKLSPICQNAFLQGANENIRNGKDRIHRIYNAKRTDFYNQIKQGDAITYSFPEQNVHGVHIVFDSDLNRETLNVSWVEKSHSMRANQRLNSPQMSMPKTLCKTFKLFGERNGKQIELLNVTNNRKRCYHLSVNECFDKLILQPINDWGNNETINVISFDFS